MCSSFCSLRSAPPPLSLQANHTTSMPSRSSLPLSLPSPTSHTPCSLFPSSPLPLSPSHLWSPAHARRCDGRRRRPGAIWQAAEHEAGARAVAHARARLDDGEQREAHRVAQHSGGDGLLRAQTTNLGGGGGGGGGKGKERATEMQRHTWRASTWSSRQHRQSSTSADGPLSPQQRHSLCHTEQVPCTTKHESDPSGSTSLAALRKKLPSILPFQFAHLLARPYVHPSVLPLPFPSPPLSLPWRTP